MRAATPSSGSRRRPVSTTAAPSSASITPGGGSPAEAKAFIKSENARWSQVIKDAGIKPE